VLRPALTGDFITACILGAVVGGRLGHVLLYDRELLWKFSTELPFWGVLEIHRGGMASHGGIAGVVIACTWFARRHGLPALAMIDTAAFITPPGLMFGRLANWVNGELPGKVLPAAMQANPPWWSVKYPEDAIVAATTPEAYQRASELSRLAYAGDTQALVEIAAMVPARYPNNFIQAFTDGPVLMAVLVLAWWAPRRAGTLTGTFLVGYGLLRNVSESFREPDPGVFRIGPLTTPILVSIAMVVLGVVVIARSARSDGPLLGGLGGGRSH
jgi:phosphatidylglycerol:prolipoprotein diacylglycerol transferase